MLSSWGSSNYRPSAPFLFEVASHVKKLPFRRLLLSTDPSIYNYRVISVERPPSRQRLSPVDVLAAAWRDGRDLSRRRQPRRRDDRQPRVGAPPPRRGALLPLADGDPRPPTLRLQAVRVRDGRRRMSARRVAVGRDGSTSRVVPRVGRVEGRRRGHAAGECSFYFPHSRSAVFVHDSPSRHRWVLGPPLILVRD